MTDRKRTSMVADLRDLHRVERIVASILAETDRPVEVYAGVLETIGLSLGWELGAVWEVGPDDERLRCACTWHAGDGAPEFEALSERMYLGRGEGLPGRVFDSADMESLIDASLDFWLTEGRFAAHFEREFAQVFGIRKALCVNSVSSVNSVALSDDASLLVTGSSDGRFARGRLPAGAKPIGPQIVPELGDPGARAAARRAPSERRRTAIR